MKPPIKVKLNFNRPVNGLNGEQMRDDKGEPIWVNKALANNLVGQPEGDAVKFYDWGLQLYKLGVLELDRSDFNLLKSFVEKLTGVAIIYKAQVLECFILTPTEGDGL